MRVNFEHFITLFNQFTNQVNKYVMNFVCMHAHVHQTKKQINYQTHFMVHLDSWTCDSYTFDYGVSC